MLLKDAWKATLSRWRHPGIWMAAFLLPPCFAWPFFAPAGKMPPNFPWRPSVAAISLFWCLSILSTGLPVLWSGDRRPRSGVLRGLLQILALEVLLHVLVIAPFVWVLKGKNLFILLGFTTVMFVVQLVFLGIVHWLVAHGDSQEMEIHEAERQALAAEALVQRASFSPVLLYESLHGLQRLEDPVALERGLVDLAVLFRTWLVHHDRPSVTFGEERALSELYLRVVRRTHCPDLPLQATWDPEADLRQIPPLGLSQLLESVCRGAETHPLTSVRVSSHALPGGLELCLDLAGPGAAVLGAQLPDSPAWSWIQRRMAPWGLREPKMSLETGEGTARLHLTLAEARP